MPIITNMSQNMAERSLNIMKESTDHMQFVS